MKLVCKYVFYTATRYGKERESVMTVETVCREGVTNYGNVNEVLRKKARHQLTNEGFTNIKIQALEDI